MGLGPLTVDTAVFNDYGNGRYVNSVTTFGGVRDEFRITPGRVSERNGYKQTNASVTYLWEADIVQPDGSTKRVPFTGTLQLQVPAGVTVAQVDSSVALLSSLVTTDFLNKVLSGGS